MSHTSLSHVFYPLFENLTKYVLDLLSVSPLSVFWIFTLLSFCDLLCFLDNFVRSTERIHQLLNLFIKFLSLINISLISGYSNRLLHIFVILYSFLFPMFISASLPFIFLNILNSIILYSMTNNSNIGSLLEFISVVNISNDSHLFGNYFLLISLETSSMEIFYLYYEGSEKICIGFSEASKGSISVKPLQIKFPARDFFWHPSRMNLDYKHMWGTASYEFSEIYFFFVHWASIFETGNFITVFGRRKRDLVRWFLSLGHPNNGAIILWSLSLTRETIS